MTGFEKEIGKEKPVLLACLCPGTFRGEQVAALREAASSLGDTVLVCILDEDSIPAFARKYDVVGTPTFLLFAGGFVRDCFLGKADGGELVEFVRAGLKRRAGPPVPQCEGNEWLRG